MGESCLTSSQCVRPRGGDIPQPRLPQTSMFGDRNHQLCVNTLNLAACSSPTQQSCYHLSFVPRRFQSRDKDWIQCFVGCLVEPACQTPTACLFLKEENEIKIKIVTLCSRLILHCSPVLYEKPLLCFDCSLKVELIRPYLKLSNILSPQHV